jgi:predicted nucleic acid-binding protein
MRRTIISDTSCLIALTNIGELELLKKVYDEITTTSEVENEYGEKLPAWIKIKNPKDKLRQQILELQIDKGEASIIALALEIPKSIIIVDDDKEER